MNLPIFFSSSCFFPHLCWRFLLLFVCCFNILTFFFIRFSSSHSFHRTTLYRPDTFCFKLFITLLGCFPPFILLVFIIAERTHSHAMCICLRRAKFLMVFVVTCRFFLLYVLQQFLSCITFFYFISNSSFVVFLLSPQLLLRLGFVLFSFVENTLFAFLASLRWNKNGWIFATFQLYVYRALHHIEQSAALVYI